MLLTLLSPTQCSALDPARGRGLINRSEMKVEDGKQHGAVGTVPFGGRWLLTQQCKAGSALRSGPEVCLSLCPYDCPTPAAEE